MRYTTVYLILFIGSALLEYKKPGKLSRLLLAFKSNVQRQVNSIEQNTQPSRPVALKPLYF